jgi:hypothetical protein
MRWLLAIIGALVILVIGYGVYVQNIANPRVVTELRSDPEGDRAARTMVLTLPDGTELPVNYLFEGDRVFAGADGRWWRAFEGDGAPVVVLIRGRTLTGHAKVELEDRAYIEDVFSRLRPAASWVPASLDAKLVVITLEGAERDC